MKVTVNEKPVSATVTEGTTLEALLDDLRSRGEIPADQVVVGLNVGGHTWGAREFELQLGSTLQGVGRVDIDTDDMRGYGCRILTDAASMLAVMCQAAGEIARQFRTADPQQASANLFNLLDSLQRFLFCLVQVRNICAPDAPDAALNGPTNGLLSEALDRVQACQELEDWTALADSIEEDLTPALRGFGDVLVSLRDVI